MNFFLKQRALTLAHRLLILLPERTPLPILPREFGWTSAITRTMNLWGRCLPEANTFGVTMFSSAISIQFKTILQQSKSIENIFKRAKLLFLYFENGFDKSFKVKSSK